MDERTMLAGAVALVAVAAVAAVILAPTGKDKVAKRATTVMGGRRPKASGAASADPARERSRRVQEALKTLEEKGKKKPKLSLGKMLEQAGLSIEPKQFYIFSAGAALFGAGVGFYLGQPPVVIGLCAVFFGLGFPRWLLGFLRKRRQKKFLNDFSNALDVIVRGVRSGLPVHDCMRMIASEGRPPISEEFHLLNEGIRLGLSLEQSLDRMVERMPLPDVNFFAIVLVIQQKTGGNLAEALANLSRVIRARKQMQGKVRALSAEAQASALIIGSLPFLVMVMVQMMSPDYLTPLFTTSMGQLMLLGAGIWMGTGIFVMKKMISIKV